MVKKTDKLTLHIANRLQTIRNDRRMTQKQVADKANIDINYYAKLERAESTPSIKMLEKVSKALSVHSSEIMPF